MKARTLTAVSSAMLLLAAQSIATVWAQQTAPAPAATPAPADKKTQQAEREAAEPAVTEPAITEPAEAEPAATNPATPTSGATAGSTRTPAPSSAGAGSSSGGRFKTVDRLELESSAITGNRELPKVLYIVPWKKADLGDLIGRPANSLLDEVLTPVDRDVFRRQTEYYSKLEATPAAAQPEGASAAGSVSEPQQPKAAPPPR